MWARNASVNVGCECSCRTISSLSTNVTLHAVTAVAVVIRRGWPARQPSPKNAPWSMTATTRCAPARDRNDSRTVPFCTYITLVAGWPCEQIVRSAAYSTLRVVTPAQSITGEGRDAGRLFDLLI